MTDRFPPIPASQSAPSPPERLVFDENASLPAEGADYVRFLRGPRWRKGKGLLGIVVGLAVFFLVVNVVSSPFIIGVLLTGGSVETLEVDAPVVTLVSIAASLPMMLLVQRWVFGVQGRWLHSVAGRFRWRLALGAALVMTIVLAISMVVTAAVEGTPLAPDLSVMSILMVVAALVVIPFQAAAEEYLVRGIIARSAGAGARRPWVGLTVSVLMSSLVFALLHGNLLPGLMIYYTLFGAFLWWLTWRTGGLEAAVGVHAAFNILVFLQGFLFAQPVGLSTTVTAAEQFSALWVVIPLAVAVLVILWWFRRTGVRRTFAGVESGLAGAVDGSA